MIRRALTVIAVACGLTASPVLAQESTPVMDITRKDDMQTVEGPAEYFTGRATITGQFQRTAWRTHPLGQTLIVTEGVGWTQIEGGPKLEFHAGDILWRPAEHKHWQGATPHGPMAHYAVQESLNGSPVT